MLNIYLKIETYLVNLYIRIKSFIFGIKLAAKADEAILKADIEKFVNTFKTKE